MPDTGFSELHLRSTPPGLCSGDERCAEELGRMLRARLAYSLAGRGDVNEADLDDFSQEACARVIASLDSFRGDAKFSTWATTIAIRVALTALRRRAWTANRTRDVLASASSNEYPSTPAERPERAEIYGALRRAIDTVLTDYQRRVILAELRGVPQIRLAEQLGVTPSAVYKATHDARKKLRDALEMEGFGPALERDTAFRASEEMR